MKTYYFVIFIVLLLSCSSDDKAVDIVAEGIERGAILRNIAKISKDFEHTNFDSQFNIILEEQDLENGGLLDFVRMYVTYVDHNPDNGANSLPEIMVRDILRDEFATGPVGLPRTNLVLSYQEVVDALNIESSLILPGDQFKLRLDLHLNDGRTFSNDSGSGTILTDICFFKSPYRYEIAVVEPLVQDAFTGVYSYELITGDIFDFEPQEGLVTLTESEFSSTRNFNLGFSEPMEITFSGSNVYTKIYHGVSDICRNSAEITLSGPSDISFGEFQVLDESVFFLDVVIGFEGWTGGLGLPRPVRYRFSKQ